MFKKILKFILILILAIIIVLVALGLYIWFKNPLGLKGVIQQKVAPQTVEMDATYDHPLLDAAQEKQLRNIGIDPAKLPTEVTPEQQECLKEKLGAERVEQLLKGQSPTATDALKTASCL